MYVCPDCGERAPDPGRCLNDDTQLASTGGDTLLGATVGSFRITRLIGAGGMGRVYRAVQPAIGGRVAIKVLSEECSREGNSIERFFSEARAVNLIRHEKIVNIVDLSSLPDGRPYIVMEFLDGSPLAHLFRTRGALPIGGFARFMLEVLDAVGAAHQRGVVHRDLKPDNIFVSPAGHATVLDFGIAKLAELGAAGLTQTGQLLGTPKYMSPEQALGREADARADVYALGLILYEGVVGAHPFAWTNTYDLLKKQVEIAPQPPSERREGVPRPLEAVIMQALEKDPNRRFKDANAMRRAILDGASELPPDSLDVVGAPHSKRAQYEEDSRRRADTEVSTSRPEVNGSTSASVTPSAEEPPTVAGPRAAPMALLPPTAMQPEQSLAPAAPKRSRVPMIAAILALLLGLGAVGAMVFLRVLEPDAKAKKTKGDPSSHTDDEDEPKDKPQKSAASSDPTPPADKDEELPDLPAKKDLARFDVVGFIDKAAILARAKIGSDAKLWMFYAAASTTDGTVTVTDSSVVIYYFVSLKRMKHPDGCGVMVMLSMTALTSQRYPENSCDRNTVTKPKCTFKQILEKAKEKGFKPTTASVSTSFMNIALGTRWTLAAPDGQASMMLEDDCS